MKREVWLYGSVARGAYTEHSDLDILALPRGAVIPGLQWVIDGLPQHEFCSVTSYTWDEVARMAEYGSLFLVHLRSEGRLLHEEGSGSGLQAILDALPPYTRHDRELRGFAMALDDGLENLRDGGDVRFELGVAGRVIRHASILACYLAGDPKFDRTASITSAFRLTGMTADDLDLAVALTAEIRRRDREPFHCVPSRREAVDMFNLARTFVGRVATDHAAA